MSFDVLTLNPPNGARTRDRIIFPYPAGRTSDDYESMGAYLSINSGELAFRQSDEVFSLSYKSDGIHLHWNAGPLVPSGKVWTLRTPLSTAAHVADGIRDANTNLYNFRPDNLKKWRKGRANVLSGTANSRLLCVGDSTTVGQGAGSGGATTNAKTRAFPTLLATLLSSAVKTGIASFCGTNALGGAGLNPYDPRITVGSGWGQTFASLSPAIQNSTTTNPLAFLPATSWNTADVYYSLSSGGGTFTLDVDGGAALATVSTNGTTALAKQTVTTTLGSHTLNITRTTGGAVRIVAVVCYDSGTKEVSVINAGHSSSKVSDWADTSSAITPINAIPYIAPDLTLINLGINNWTTAGPDTATFTTQYQSIITAAKSVGDVVLIIPNPSSSANAAIADRASITQAIYALASSNDLPLIDLTQRLVSQSDANALGLYYDGLHPNALGYADIAQIVAKALLV